jgi:5-methylthioadenosine/S-adenosylhomocysteine deaminase
MSGRTLVLGDPVITLGKDALIRDGALIIEGSRITAVGPRAELETRGPFTEVLGGQDSIVMPGFINCHYHSELAGGPGLYQFIFEIANVYVQGGYGPIGEEDLQDLILLGLVSAIKGGQTATLDMYYGRPALPLFGTLPALEAYRSIGMRTAFGLVSRDQNLYVHQANEDFLKGLPADLVSEIRQSPMGYAWPIPDVMETYDTLVREWDGRDGRFRIVLAPDWTPACSDDLYRLCRRKADEDGTGIVSHVLETRSEMMWNLETYGMPALQRLKNLGVLGPDMTCTHFVWVTDDELSIFADSGAVASNNPGSNLRLSAGICRTRDIMASGGRVAFGTDGISFSDSEDMFTELRLACYLQRFPREFDVVRLDSEDVFRAAAANGARAIRQEEGLGSLTEGKLADILVVDSGRILFPPGRYDSEPILNVILDRAQAVDLRHVMINGEVVMRDRAIATIDEQALMDRVAEAVDKRVYRLSPEVKRWLELGDAVMPNVVDFYKRWYSIPVEPAHNYNARRVLRGKQ